MANQPLGGKLNATSASAGHHSIHKKELNLSERIREAIGEESVASFSRRCDIGDSTVRKYLDGALPNSINLVAIADTANVSIEWLAAGRGPKQRGAAAVPMIPPAPQLQPSLINIDDLERLTMAIETVEEALEAMRRIATPTQRAKLYTAAYDLLIDMEPRENIIKFIKLAA